MAGRKKGAVPFLSAIVAAAGSGRRMRSKREKPFIKLCRRELIYHVLKALQASPLISEIVIASRGKYISRIKRLAKAERFTKVKVVVKGGRRRADSVLNALSEVSASTDIVLVHDVARPFITQDIIRRTVNAAKRYGAAVPAVPAVSTIKEAAPKGLFVERTLDRRLLWEAQTPQVFKKSLLADAYKRFGAKASGFTDESSMVEHSGRRVRIVRGSPYNIKITTPIDIAMGTVLKGTPLGTKFSKIR